MTDLDFTEAIYAFLRRNTQLDDHGRLVSKAEIHPWLLSEHQMSRSGAQRVRTRCVKELERQGRVRRFHPRSIRVEILD